MGVTKQYVAAISASLSALLTGSCYAWMTPIMPYLISPESELPITNKQLPWVVAILELGTLISPIPAGILCNYIGRRPVILACGPLFILSWVMILYIPTALMLGAARVVQGLAMGLVFIVTPIYLGEIASTAIRGSITGIFYNSFWVGFLIEYIVGPSVSFTTYTYFTLSLNIPFILLFFWQPESPYYYMLRGKEEKAYKSLRWLRSNTDEKLEEELREIKMSLEEGKQNPNLQDLFATPADRKAMTILQTLTMVRIFSGSSSLTVYGTLLFQMTPNLFNLSHYITLSIGVVLLLGSFIGCLTIDVIGRRPLLLTSCIGSFICQFLTSLYYFLLFKTSLDVRQYSWTVPVLILIFCGLSTAGMFPVCSAYTSELFTASTRGIASSVTDLNITIVSFIVLLSYQPVVDELGVFVNFLIYSIVILIGSVYFYFSAPETKGKPFTQIREELQL